MSQQRASYLSIALVISTVVMAIAFLFLPWVNLLFVQLTGFQVAQMLLSRPEANFSTVLLWLIPLYAVALASDGIKYIKTGSLSGIRNNYKGGDAGIVIGITIVGVIGLYPFYWFYSDLSSTGIVPSSLIVENGFLISLIGYLASIYIYYQLIVAVKNLQGLKQAKSFAEIPAEGKYDLILKKVGNRDNLAFSLSKMGLMSYEDAYNIGTRIPIAIAHALSRETAVEMKQRFERDSGTVIDITASI